MGASLPTALGPSQIGASSGCFILRRIVSFLSHVKWIVTVSTLHRLRACTRFKCLSCRHVRRRCGFSQREETRGSNPLLR